MNGSGIFRIHDMVGSRECQAGLPDGRYVRAVPEPFYFGLFTRIRAALAVLKGKDATGRPVVAVEWPKHGDLETALSFRMRVCP